MKTAFTSALVAAIAAGAVQTKDREPVLSYKDVEFKADTLTEDGEFSGYLSRHGEVDAGLDRVMPGAFKKTLREWEKSSVAMPLLWAHDPREPIGQFVELKEDNVGLWFRAQLELDVQKAKEARALMRTDAKKKRRTLSGMSIGYSIVKDKTDRDTGVRDLVELRLWEGSLVVFPMLGSARVESAKGAEASRLLKVNGRLAPLKDFERFLREAGGLSKSQATCVASHGWAQLIRSESGAEELKQQVAESLAILSTIAKGS